MKKQTKPQPEQTKTGRKTEHPIKHEISFTEFMQRLIRVKPSEIKK